VCVEDVARWFLENGLLLNPTKTEAVLFGTRFQRNKIPTASGIGVAGTVVPFRDTVKLLDVTLDSAHDDGPAMDRTGTLLKLYAAATTTYVLCGISDDC